MFLDYNYYCVDKQFPLNKHSLNTNFRSLVKTKEMIVFDYTQILYETRVKLIRDDYELKTSQRLQ